MPKEHSGNKYLRTILPRYEGTPIQVDVYNVIDAFEVTCPARTHALKKILCAGLRGKGDEERDIREAIDALERALELHRQHALKELATSEEMTDERPPVPSESSLKQVHASHEWDGTRTGRIATCLACQCRDVQGTAYEVCKPKTEFCCACGEDYPRSDLIKGGQIYCGKCRYSEMHRSHVWTDTKQRNEKCTKCGCIATSTESYRPCGRGNG